MAFVTTSVAIPLRVNSSSSISSRTPLPISARITCSAAKDESNEGITRRGIIGRAAAFALATILGRTNREAIAEIEYPNVGFLGGGDIVDVNNANVRAYQKFPGMYPTIAGLIVTNGPFKSVDEILDMKDLTNEQKAVIGRYKENLVALKPTPEYELDKINNGLYK